ncbi:MAG: hypothetical protein JJT82_09745 [Legionellaceae bacterium]|nr:hypothetical protein [Legionellaceae bacterium]
MKTYMRLMTILLWGLFCSHPLFALNESTSGSSDSTSGSHEAVRARIKIKFALDPLLAKEKITLQQQKNGLVLVGQVSHPIMVEQALYLITQSNVEVESIKNELLVEDNPISPSQLDHLIETAANARITAASKYQMQDIPLVGLAIRVDKAQVIIQGEMNPVQKENVKKALNGISEIKSIEFLPHDTLQ